MATLTFTGGPTHADPDWNNPLNWDLYQVPMDGDSVVIGDNPNWAAPVFNGGQINLQDLSVDEESFLLGPGALITVAGSFQWTGGYITDGGTIRILGQGSVTGLPNLNRRGPTLMNDSILDVRGTLTISRPGSLPLIGGAPQILNFGTIFLDFGGVQMANAAAVINYGTIEADGNCGFSGSDITNFGTLTIPFGILYLSGEAVLHLVAGGQVTGAGRLQIGFDDQDQGTLSIEADTVLPPELTLNLTGGNISSPLPISPQPTLQINGQLNMNGGWLDNVHVSLGPTAQSTVSGNASTVHGAQLDNHGVITILPGAVWYLNSGAQVNNLGRLSLQGDTSIIWDAGTADVVNTGLIESLGGLPNKIIGVSLSSTGNIAVKEGALSLFLGAMLTSSGGSIFVRQTTLDSPDNTGGLILAGGTEGGVLRGRGTIGTSVTNGGSIEPDGLSLNFLGNYSQSTNGGITLPAAALGDVVQPLLSFNGPSTSLGGTLWCFGPVAPGIAKNVINIGTAPPQLGKFTKVRAADDDTRLVLNYPAAAGELSAQITRASGYYGLDIGSKPAAHELQDLFDNTPFSYLGFYFYTTGHPHRDWLRHAKELLNQGWALLPIYMGRQQYWKYQSPNSDNQISADIPTATQQGTADGADAINKANAENFPAGSLIFLDIEPTQSPNPQPPPLLQNVAPAAQTFAYINAWLAAVGGSQYVPALYDANEDYIQNGQHFREAPVIRNNINMDPITWVAWGTDAPPPGVAAAHWPLDDNGDVYPIAIQRYGQGIRWDFAQFARLWQFRLDWPANTSWGDMPAATVITDIGAAYPLSRIRDHIDLNTSLDPDPARTNGSVPKHDRRTRVTGISASNNGTVQTGASIKLTITLNRQAPAPNGTLVILRCDSSDIIVPSSARVRAGSTSVTVDAAAVVGASAAAVNVLSRTLYQLTDAPASMTLTITA